MHQERGHVNKDNEAALVFIRKLALSLRAVAGLQENKAVVAIHAFVCICLRDERLQVISEVLPGKIKTYAEAIGIDRWRALYSRFDGLYGG